MNVLIGEIKEQLPYLLTDDQKQIDQIIQQIIKIASKELVATKIPAPTNAKRKKILQTHKLPIQLEPRILKKWR